MSLLSTFGILFETDAEDAKKEIDGVNKSLEDTEGTANEAAESFDELANSVDESADSFFELSDGLGVAAAGLISVVGLFAGITAKALGTDEIGKFSETLGLNIEDVGAWGEAVTRSGGDAASFRGSLEGLNSQLTDISLTGGGEAAEIFARLGVNAVGAGGQIKSAFDVLPELADAFEGLSKSESVGFGEKLGLDQGTILLLQQGRVAVEQLVGRQKELGVTTQEDYLAAAAFNDEIADTKQVFANLFASAGTTILPLLTTMLDGFQSIVGWIQENKTLVTGFFIGVAGAITAFYLPAIASAAAATLVAAAPFIAIGAAIAAVGLAFAVLYEDVVAYIGGQSSFIGDLVEEYEWLGTIIDTVVGGIKAAFETLGDVFDWVATLFLSPTEAINQLKETVSSMVDEALNIIPDLGESFDDALSGIKSFFGFGDEEVEANIEKAITVTGTVDNNPLNGQTSASIVNSQQSKNQTNNVNIAGSTINTQATDAAGVATAVNGNLNNQVQMATGALVDAEAY